MPKSGQINETPTITFKQKLSLSQRLRMRATQAFYFCLSLSSGIAFGAGAVYGAFKLVSSTNPAPWMLPFRNIFVIPSMIFGTIAWAVAYVKPSIKSAKDYYDRTKNPIGSGLANEYQELRNALKWFKLSPTEETRLLRRYFNERLKEAVIRDYQEVELGHAEYIGDQIQKKQDSIVPTVVKKDMLPRMDYTNNTQLSREVQNLMAIVSYFDEALRTGKKSDAFNLDSMNMNAEQIALSRKLLDACYQQVIANNNPRALMDDLEQQLISTDQTSQTQNKEAIEKYNKVIENTFIKTHTRLSNARKAYEMKARPSSPDEMQMAQNVIDKMLSEKYAEAIEQHRQVYSEFMLLDYPDAKPLGNKTDKFSYVGWIIKNALVPSLSNINAFLVNSIGVALGFMTAINAFFLPATGVYSAAASSWLLSAFALSFAGGAFCALSMTAISFKKVTKKLFSRYLDPEYFDSPLSKSIRDAKEKTKTRGDHMWSWLTNMQDWKKNVVTGFFSLGSSLFNFIAGVRGYMLGQSLYRYFTKRAASGTMPLLNMENISIAAAPLSAKVFGLVSAAVTFIMSASMLSDVANSAKHQTEHPRKSWKANLFIYTMSFFAVFGQAYQQYVNTLWPDGIQAMLGTLGVPLALQMPAVYVLGLGISSGLVICSKLLVEATDDVYTLIFGSNNLKINSAAQAPSKASAQVAGTAKKAGDKRSVFARLFGKKNTTQEAKKTSAKAA